MAPASKIAARNLYKVFGPTPELAIDMLRRGATKDEVLKTGNVVAINNVSLAVPAGEIFAVMGLSGSGKSTLIRCINRLVPSTSGELRIDGEDVMTMSIERLRMVRLEKVAMVFQHFSIFPHFSVVENVEYGLRVRGVEKDARRKRALEVMSMVGLDGWAHADPSNLSGGMRQRVGIARALALDPQVLLMDEPFGALDPLIRREMHRELSQIQKNLRMTIVVITHDLYEALTLGDSIAIMKDGEIIQQGSREDIITRPTNDYVASFAKDVDPGRVIRVASIMTPAVSCTGPLATSDADALMRQKGCTSLYLIDHDGKPLRMITHRELSHTYQHRPMETDKPNGQGLPTVELSAPLSDVFAYCGDGLPVAVIDQEGRLCGKINPTDVLLALAGRRSCPTPEALHRSHDGLFRVGTCN